MDPVTRKPKGFGYCMYGNATDALRALKLLNGFSVDSKQMLVKVDSKTQAKLNEYAQAMTVKMKEEFLEKDAAAKKALQVMYEERSGLLGGHQNDPASWGGLIPEGDKRAKAEEANEKAFSDENSREQRPEEGEEQEVGEGDKDDKPRTGVSPMPVVFFSSTSL